MVGKCWMIYPLMYDFYYIYREKYIRRNSPFSTVYRLINAQSINCSMIYGDDIEIKFNKRKEFNSCSKSIPFVLETNILRIMEQILFNIICRRRSSTESEHQSERCIVHHGTKERNLVARNGMRERSEGN